MSLGPLRKGNDPCPNLLDSSIEYMQEASTLSHLVHRVVFVKTGGGKQQLCLPDGLNLAHLPLLAKTKHFGVSSVIYPRRSPQLMTECLKSNLEEGQCTSDDAIKMMPPKCYISVFAPYRTFLVVTKTTHPDALLLFSKHNRER